jgi:hypothetical protein
MSGTKGREDLILRRRKRPKFHKALVIALIISLILAVMLIMFLSRYLSAPTTDENGLLDRSTPLMVTVSGSLLHESDPVLQMT